MALGPSIALTVVVAVVVGVPSWRLGQRVAASQAQPGATPEERAARRRRRAARRREQLAALTRRERTLFYAYYGFSIPAMPAGFLLTIFGSGTARTVGIVLLVVVVLLMAVPVGPILSGRLRRRGSAQRDVAEQ